MELVWLVARTRMVQEAGELRHDEPHLSHQNDTGFSRKETDDSVALRAWRGTWWPKREVEVQVSLGHVWRHVLRGW